MALLPEHHLVLERFLHYADFDIGSVTLDLDGTSLLEESEKVFISSSVEKGLKKVVDVGQPVIINTLRFALRVTETIGKEWLALYNSKIPVVLLNGSVIGYVYGNSDDNKIFFEERAAYPLFEKEVDAIIEGLGQLLENGIREMLVFFYPRDWKQGEILWSPSVSYVEELKRRYFTASRVVSWGIEELRTQMKELETCMVHVMVHRSSGTLMAYQHSQPNTYFTRKGVSKASGNKEMAKRLGVSLDNSIGAGNTEMDTFLTDVGLAIVVGKDRIPFAGRRETLTVDDPRDLGELMISYANKIRERREKFKPL